MIIARSQYDERVSVASDLSFKGDVGLTKQSDAKDCDINAIFKRFEKTGQLPDLIKENGHYGDFSAVPDYQTALEIVRLANDQFAALDVHIRNRFDNDPSKFLGFVTDAANVDEVEKMGLLKPEVVAARQAQRNKESQAIADKIAADKAIAEKELIEKIKAELKK